MTDADCDKRHNLSLVHWLILKMATKVSYKCSYPECEWAFESNYKLQRHLQSHGNEKPFVCELCKKAFSYQYNLNSHLKTHEKKAREKTLNNIIQLRDAISSHLYSIKCTKKNCAQSFETKEELQDHIKNHELKYHCSYENCSKRFKKPSLLKLHEGTHNNELPFKCTFEKCNKAYVNHQRLKRHMLTHENKKQYQCKLESCGKSFNRVQYLKAHMRIHEDKKGFSCPVANCERSFVCAETLKVHLQRHVNFRPFKCDHADCDKSYLTLANLKAHKKLHLSGKLIKNKQLIYGDKLCNKGDINKSVSVNDFLNSKLFEATCSGNMSISSCQILTQEDLVTSTLGELVCNQYIDTKDPDRMPHLTGEETAMTLAQSYTDASSLNQTHDSLIVSDIEDIQFQEEFVTSIYTPAVHDFGVFASGHDYEESSMSAVEKEQAVFLPPNIGKLNDLDNDIRVSDNEIDTFESSMELSTGHLVIDGGYFGSSSCMPDHIYSHRNLESNSTVNLQDIH